MLLTTSGGIAGGDRLRIAVSVEAGAAALLTSQAAEKIYRSLGPEARCAVSLQIGDGAWLEWLPQETILFQAARFSRSIEAKLSATGRLLASEIVVFGRLARGERFSSGRLQDRWRLHRGGGLIWTDAVCLEDRPGDDPRVQHSMSPWPSAARGPWRRWSMPGPMRPSIWPSPAP